MYYHNDVATECVCARFTQARKSNSLEKNARACTWNLFRKVYSGHIDKIRALLYTHRENSNVRVEKTKKRVRRYKAHRARTPVVIAESSVHRERLFRKTFVLTTARSKKNANRFPRTKIKYSKIHRSPRLHKYIRIVYARTHILTRSGQLAEITTGARTRGGVNFFFLTP